jgi:hypothetical protein
MRFLTKLQNRWEARRLAHRQKEAEELAAEVRGEFHTLRETKDELRDTTAGMKGLGKMPKP